MIMLLDRTLTSSGLPERHVCGYTSWYDDDGEEAEDKDCRQLQGTEEHDSRRPYVVDYHPLRDGFMLVVSFGDPRC